MTHEKKIAQWIGPGKIGTEIGPGNSPIPGVNPRPIYVDCFKEFGHVACLADYYGHARALPFRENSLDYVLASHVLEHVANPVAALAEWYRVVRPGGIIYLIVPDRRFTWDRGRALTTVEHMLADYFADTSAADPSHIDEFVNDVIWDEWGPSIPPEEVPGKKTEIAQALHAAVARGEEINIHFHTFEPASIRALLQCLAAGGAPAAVRAARARPPDLGPGAPELPRLHWELVDFADRFPVAAPNGVLAILRVHKSWRARADAEALRLRQLDDGAGPLTPDAEPFAEWSARFPGLGSTR